MVSIDMRTMPREYLDQGGLKSLSSEGDALLWR
jgi:hypothetical protein